MIKNFIARGSVSNFENKITNNISLKEANFSFFADKTDVLIKNFFGEVGPINIIEGDVQLKLSPEISIISNFKSKIKYKNESVDYIDLIKDFEFAKKMISLDAVLNNTFLISFDKTYKVKKYNYYFSKDKRKNYAPKIKRNKINPKNI